MNDENEVVLEKETMCEEFKWNYSESKKIYNHSYILLCMSEKPGLSGVTNVPRWCS